MANSPLANSMVTRVPENLSQSQAQPRCHQDKLSLVSKAATIGQEIKSVVLRKPGHVARVSIFPEMISLGSKLCEKYLVLPALLLEHNFHTNHSSAASQCSQEYQLNIHMEKINIQSYLTTNTKIIFRHVWRQLEVLILRYFVFQVYFMFSAYCFLFKKIFTYLQNIKYSSRLSSRGFIV